MVLTDPHITAARCRAALAYEGIVVKTEGEERTKIPRPTLNRIIAKTNPRAANTDELRLIAAACPSVPAWFFEHGFSPPVETGEDDLRQKLRAVEQQIEDLAALVAQQDEERRAAGGRGRRAGPSAVDPPE